MITLTALNDLLFDSFEIHRILVVAPLRVARLSWGMEIEKWDYLKELKYSVAVGTEKERLVALSEKADIYIINRENMQWQVENTDFDYDMIVIDELSSFKNHQSKRFKALMKVRPLAKRVVGLTGTPFSACGTEEGYHPQDKGRGKRRTSDDTGTQISFIYEMGRDCNRTWLRNRQCIPASQECFG